MPKDDYSLAKHHLSLAIDAENKGSQPEAIEHYRAAVGYFNKAIQLSSDSTVVSRCREFRSNAAERIKILTGRSKPAPGSSHTTVVNPSGTDQLGIVKNICRVLPSKDTLVKALKNVTDSAVERILKEVFESGSSVTLDDVAGNDRAKQILNEAVVLPILRPELFTGLRAPVRGVLLFGPPGNGKTMIAKAVASESNCIFFNISAASIFSKWVGESENVVRALFAVARHVQPAVIFLDEVDSLLTARETGKGNEVSRRVLTQLLAEMDGIGSSSERVLILAATNRPQELDDAALRRFPRRVYIRMPDLNTRCCLLEKLLANDTKHSLSPSDIRKIAACTDGYSASDLKQVAKEAALGPIRELNVATLRTVDANKVRPVNLKDFTISLRNIRPSTSPDKLVAYEQWNSQFGEAGDGPNSSKWPLGIGKKTSTGTVNLM